MKRTILIGLALALCLLGLDASAAKTELFSRTQPGGVNTIVNETMTTGNIWFVDSGSSTGSDAAGYGQNPDAPFATIDYAVGQCTAAQGDRIFVMPGHTETVSTAGGIDLDVAGITVIGMGAGDDRPTVTFTAEAATITVDAEDITLRNVKLVNNHDGQTIVVDVNKDDFTIEDVEYVEGSSKQALTVIDVNGGGANAADNFTARRLKITQTASGGTQAIEIGAVQDGVRIEDCWIDGDWSAAGIHSASIFTDALIARNVVSNRNSGNHAIELTAACTGVLADNRLYGDTLGTILDPGSLKCLGNLETDAVDQAGVATPRTEAGPLGVGAIATTSFAAGAIDATAIAADAITSAEIANAAIDAATFAAGAIDAAAIANDAIDATAVATGTVDADAVADDAIDAGAIAADAITSAEIANDAIGATEIANGAIDATAIANASIDAATYAADVGQWRTAVSDWDFSTDTGAQAGYTVFTVTGVVEVVVYGVCTDAMTSGGTTTVELGVAGNTAVLIAQIADATDLIANEIYIDATPTTTVEQISPWSHSFVVTNGQDIVFTIGGANAATGGHVDFYCLWRPLSATGNVVAN